MMYKLLKRLVIAAPVAFTSSTAFTDDKPVIAPIENYNVQTGPLKSDGTPMFVSIPTPQEFFAEDGKGGRFLKGSQKFIEAFTDGIEKGKDSVINGVRKGAEAFDEEVVPKNTGADNIIIAAKSRTDIEKLRDDVYAMYLDYKDQFSGPRALATGIPLTFACDNLSTGMQDIKLCLNGLKSVDDDWGGLDVKKWEGYENRWRKLNNTPTIDSTPESLKVDWPVSIYPAQIQPLMTKMRESCSSESIQERTGKVACLTSTWTATSGLSDMVTYVLTQSKGKTQDRATLRGLDQGLKNINEKCTTPLTNFTGGKLEDIFDSSINTIESCVTETGFVMYGHVEGFKETADRPADNSTPYYRGLQDISHAAIGLKAAMK